MLMEVILNIMLNMYGKTLHRFCLYLRGRSPLYKFRSFRFHEERSIALLLKKIISVRLSYIDLS